METANTWKYLDAEKKGTFGHEHALSSGIRTILIKIGARRNGPTSGGSGQQETENKTAMEDESTVDFIEECFNAYERNLLEQRVPPELTGLTLPEIRIALNPNAPSFEMPRRIETQKTMRSTAHCSEVRREPVRFRPTPSRAVYRTYRPFRTYTFWNGYNFVNAMVPVSHCMYYSPYPVYYPQHYSHGYYRM